MTLRTTATAARVALVGLAAAAMAATTLTVPAQAAPDPGPDPAADRAAARAGHAATRRAMDAEVRAGIPGITAQARDTRGVWKAASGVGDLATGTPAAPTTGSGSAASPRPSWPSSCSRWKRKANSASTTPSSTICRAW